MSKRKKKRQKAREQNTTPREYFDNIPVPAGALLIDHSRLSEKTLKVMSLSPLALKKYYQDQAFNCPGCNQSCLFTAAEQKIWYEKFKKFIYVRKVRCDKCQVELNELKEFVKTIPALLRSPNSDIDGLVNTYQLSKKHNNCRCDNALEQRLEKLKASQ